MRRIIIICEGPTEVEFCKDVLYSHFFNRNIILQTPKIKKSGGGIVSWQSLKNEIEIHLKQDNSACVTTLIDYYGIHDYHKFPSWDTCKAEPKKDERIKIVENAMLSEIDSTLSFRFIPYIQLHEFEGLLFNTIDVFDNNFTSLEMKRNALKEDIEQNENPEMINDGRDTAPSKRLSKYIKGYNKIVHGAILAQEIGLERIRSRSPRFNNWIGTLENI